MRLLRRDSRLLKWSRKCKNVMVSTVDCWCQQSTVEANSRLLVCRLEKSKRPRSFIFTPFHPKLDQTPLGLIFKLSLSKNPPKSHFKTRFGFRKIYSTLRKERVGVGISRFHRSGSESPYFLFF